MSVRYLPGNADVIGTVAQNYAITSGSNDKLQFTIDGGSPQTITLTAGASRTAAQIATDINATLSGATAYAVGNGPQAGKVRIVSTSALGASSSIAIGSPANNANTTLGFTAGTYAGPVRQFVQWTQTAGTKQELINEIETVALAAGWTTISGSGTTNLLLQSGVTPPGEDLQMRLRVKGTNTNCVSISIENVSGTQVHTNDASNGGMLLPAVGRQWNLLINKFQGMIYQTLPMTGRDAVVFGMPAIPTNLKGVLTEAMWMASNCTSDTGGNASAGFLRKRFITSDVGSALLNVQIIWNGVKIESHSNGGVGTRNSLHVMSMTFAGEDTFGNVVWQDGQGLLYDALMSWADASTPASNAKWRGQLWDAVCSTDAYTGDQSGISFDSHTWVVLTDNNVGDANSYPGGTVLIAYA